jgi:hypothetical protein
LRWQFNPASNWWKGATWGGVTGWVTGYSQPMSYSYGDNIYYEGDNVYYGDNVYATSTEYVQQAEQIAASAPPVDDAELEWLSLGVFALTQDGQSSGAEPTMFLQLAISKEGIIGGTYQHTPTDNVQSVEGMADKKSQRVAVTVGGKSRPLIETGLANLAEDTAPCLMHFADGQTQQWLLVRLDDPNAGGQ